MLPEFTADIVNYGEYLSAIRSLSSPFNVKANEGCVLNSLWGQVRYTTQPVPAYLYARVYSSWGELQFKVLNYRREKQHDILKLEYVGYSK